MKKNGVHNNNNNSDSETDDNDIPLVISYIDLTLKCIIKILAA